MTETRERLRLYFPLRASQSLASQIIRIRAEEIARWQNACLTIIVIMSNDF